MSVLIVVSVVEVTTRLSFDLTARGTRPRRTGYYTKYRFKNTAEAQRYMHALLTVIESYV
jgi:hypothetical protein